MRVLGLESSCDETACAIVESAQQAVESAQHNGAPVITDDSTGLRVLADVISSQIQTHARFGGVVPEIASRHHLINLIPVLDEAFATSGLGLESIDAIAVTKGPGLIGALLVALQAGKAIAFVRDIPLIGVHHLEGHLLATFLRNPEAPSPVPPFPHLGLLVSGGHTSLILVEGFGRYRTLGATRDDAAGEAFDKVGKMLGLGYPAGPAIDRLAQDGDPTSVTLPRPMLGPKGGLDFSFSGLKTAMADHLKRNGPPADPQALASLCASFQTAVVEQLVRKTLLALQQRRVGALVLSGGVACNRGLRAALAAMCLERGLSFYVAPPRWCTDNAAMIACAGYHRLRAGERSDLTLNASATLPL